VVAVGAGVGAVVWPGASVAARPVVPVRTTRWSFCNACLTTLSPAADGTTRFGSSGLEATGYWIITMWDSGILLTASAIATIVSRWTSDSESCMFDAADRARP
jgi:hypothetical protein